jgi:hypothetical protein
MQIPKILQKIIDCGEFPTTISITYSDVKSVLGFLSKKHVARKTDKIDVYIRHLVNDGASYDYSYPSYRAIAFYMQCSPSTAHRLFPVFPSNKKNALDMLMLERDRMKRGK